jgi:hypothetical protein
MCRVEVAHENGTHILLPFTLQCTLCYRRDGRSRQQFVTEHIFPDSFSVFLPSALCLHILDSRLVCGRAGLARKHRVALVASFHLQWAPMLLECRGTSRSARTLLDRWSPSVSEEGNFERETSE